MVVMIVMIKLRCCCGYASRDCDDRVDGAHQHCQLGLRLALRMDTEPEQPARSSRVSKQASEEVMSCKIHSHGAIYYLLLLFCCCYLLLLMIMMMQSRSYESSPSSKHTLAAAATISCALRAVQTAYRCSFAHRQQMASMPLDDDLWCSRERSCLLPQWLSSM